VSRFLLSTISMIQCRPLRPPYMVRSTCLASPSGCVVEFSRRPQARYMATRACTRNPKTIGAMSIRLVHALVTTKASVAPRHCSFNTYGPRMHPNDGRVVSKFIVQALKREPITIFGEGLQTRSFCYADDMIDGFLKFMATDAGFTGPVNLGNPSEITIREMAEIVIDLTGSCSKIESCPLPVDDPMQRRPEISLARNKLAWQPRVALRQGLRQTIEYFDALPSGKS